MNENEITSEQGGTALAPRRPLNLNEIKGVADIFIRSGVFDIQGLALAMTKIIIGRSIGISDASAMRGIFFSNGRPEFDGAILATLVKQHPRYRYRADVSDTKATVTIFERLDDEWVELGSASFGEEDARRAGLLGKSTYQKYPSDMYFNRALTRGVRRMAPDVTQGSPAYVQGEIEGDFDYEESEGEVFELYPDEDIAEFMEALGSAPRPIVLRKAKEEFPVDDSRLEAIYEQLHAPVEEPDDEDLEEVADGDFEEIEDEEGAEE